MQVEVTEDLMETLRRIAEIYGTGSHTIPTAKRREEVRSYAVEVAVAVILQVPELKAQAFKKRLDADQRDRSPL